MAVAATSRPRRRLSEHPAIVLATFLCAAIGAGVALLTYLDVRQSQIKASAVSVNAVPIFSWRFEYDKGFFIRLRLVNAGAGSVSVVRASLRMVAPGYPGGNVRGELNRLLASATGFNTSSCLVPGGRRTPHASQLNRPLPINLGPGEGMTVALAFDYSETPQPQDVDDVDLDWPLYIAAGVDPKDATPTVLLVLELVPGGQRTYAVRPLAADVKTMRAIARGAFDANVLADVMAGAVDEPTAKHGCAR